MEALSPHVQPRRVDGDHPVGGRLRFAFDHDGFFFLQFEQLTRVDGQRFAFLVGELNDRDRMHRVAGVRGAERALFAGGVRVGMLLSLGGDLRVDQEENRLPIREREVRSSLGRRIRHAADRADENHVEFFHERRLGIVGMVMIRVIVISMVMASMIVVPLAFVGMLVFIRGVIGLAVAIVVVFGMVMILSRVVRLTIAVMIVIDFAFRCVLMILGGMVRLAVPVVIVVFTGMVRRFLSPLFAWVIFRGMVGHAVAVMIVRHACFSRRPEHHLAHFQDRLGAIRFLPQQQGGAVLGDHGGVEPRFAAAADAQQREAREGEQHKKATNHENLGKLGGLRTNLPQTRRGRGFRYANGGGGVRSCIVGFLARSAKIARCAAKS